MGGPRRALRVPGEEGLEVLFLVIFYFGFGFLFVCFHGEKMI